MKEFKNKYEYPADKTTQEEHIKTKILGGKAISYASFLVTMISIIPFLEGVERSIAERELSYLIPGATAFFSSLAANYCSNTYTKDRELELLQLSTDKARLANEVRDGYFPSEELPMDLQDHEIEEIIGSKDISLDELLNKLDYHD